ncbi:EamA family transporter [Rapidithrix thailandica]|uniref:EamA family transporter n=1 Tax=Rapidithrix thailandica TaxID=413964 RepID=A0AAW9S6I7_9BACT
MLKDQLQLHFIVFLWGFTAILGVLIDIPSTEVVILRTFISALALGGLLFFIRKSLSLPRRVIWKILGIGGIVGLHWTLFFAAAKISTVSVTLIGIATTSLFTAFIDPLINRSKIKVVEIFLGSLVIIGLYVIFRFEYEHVIGLSIALVSASFSALFSVLNSRMVKAYDSLAIAFYEMVGACISTILLIPVFQLFITEAPLSVPTPSDWLYLGLLALGCTVFPFYRAIHLMKRISAFNINLAVNLEPIYGIILAVFIFGEREKMSPAFYLGTGIILVSVLMYPMLNKKFSAYQIPLSLRKKKVV